MNQPNGHVLLIEDNPGDADLVRLRLVEANSDLSVSCVDRLSSGIESIAQKPPSVVLLDLNLPDSHGADTFRNVLLRAPGVPVVVLSGHDDEDVAINAVHQGVQDYLVKGKFDSKQLARAMRYAVERQALLTSLDMSRKQQLQFKDEFLSHVSHELRTPLTCIHQFVTILLDGLAGDVQPEQREHLDTILRSVTQLRTMIADLLEATRAESGKLRVEARCMVVADVVRQAVAMLRATAREKQVGLELAVDSRIPLVHGDPDRILQMITNLIDNAIKFTPPDGSVMVKAFMVDGDPDFVYVSITDTGRGISAETKPLIFERLYQDPHAIDNSRKGLGLGLYIVKELVRLHGGRIWVESQLSHGSVFSFTLPVFSLATLLAPVITNREGSTDRLHDSLTLLTIELAARTASKPANWSEVRQSCLNLLQGCILPTRDLVLPVWGNHSRSDAFVILASTDERGAEVLCKRIRGQLQRSPEMQAGAFGSVTSITLRLPSPAENETLKSLTQRVVDDITGRILTVFQQQTSNLHAAMPTTDTVTNE